eukprot:CAMPEP_0201518074 /NCGR_PEP_ID=MMETSP0161_2-20130828/9005_1 /ASSEMBLY_ACC=CAM_ASM_000251 /TAXON_ID=180227 /ORGANISM="Neoparamoeba aestuarina, Strain SoJaBio B1-5/56/2" /LENGTH=64 /DNA_ID=CAMNT_0047915737 /DNA_START=76 /DNA_END=270 /DNA_ORIENTATION=+
MVAYEPPIRNIPEPQARLALVQKARFFQTKYGGATVRWGAVGFVGLMFLCSTNPYGMWKYVTKS